MARILIVDDLLENRYMLDVLLHGNGYETLLAENGATALAMLQREPVDLIISDILMPVMDGFALCRKCKEAEATRGIPFVFYTATYTDPRDEKFALSLGADRFLIKPQQPEVLFEILRGILTGAGQSVSPYPLGPEMEFFRQHNAVLFKKLEDKMRELEHEVAERRRAEEEILLLNRTLEDRIEERTVQLLEANGELEAFAYTVSHDLRAPLRAIDGYGSIMTKEYAEKLDEEGHRMMGIICSEAERMGKLIDDLLVFSLMGTQAQQPMHVDMEALAQGVFESCAAREPDRRIEFRLLSPPPTMADLTLLRQVMINLVSNAIKYTRPRAQACIEVGGRTEGKDHVYWVKDNGVGFDMKYAHKLFAVFQRMHSYSQFEGTGVGLAIVRRIIQRHGGRVWAEAAIDQGATIFFTLPA